MRVVITFIVGIGKQMIMTFCRAPFTGLTIDPAGNLNMCCSTSNRKQFNTKISDVENLSEFFLDTQMSELRQRMKSQ